MNWKELMASNQGKVVEWLRVMIVVIALTAAAVATFTHWQSRRSFDQLRETVNDYRVSTQRMHDDQAKTNSQLEALLHLHETRLTSIEANKFTRIDGERLQLQISDNVKGIAVIQTDLAYIKNAVSSSNEKIDRLLERRQLQ